jgi:RHS repeat-associated protein
LEKQGSTTTATYTYGNALIRKDGETPLFDGLGSERTVTSSSQAVTATLTTEGFGQMVATTGSSTDPYMFAATSGYRNDGDAGLMHVGARYYDAQVGRFITRDTQLDQKPYLYCEHDPVNGLDPSGHFDWNEVQHNRRLTRAYPGDCPSPVGNRTTQTVGTATTSFTVRQTSLPLSGREYCRNRRGCESGGWLVFTQSVLCITPLASQSHRLLKERIVGKDAVNLLPPGSGRRRIVSIKALFEPFDLLFNSAYAVF